jgi:hypothetical protein
VSTAFHNCTNLPSITIPDRVTSIGWYAFTNCTGLASFIFGVGIQSLGSNRFNQVDDDQLMALLTIVPNHATRTRGE